MRFPGSSVAEAWINLWLKCTCVVLEHTYQLVPTHRKSVRWSVSSLHVQSLKRCRRTPDWLFMTQLWAYTSQRDIATLSSLLEHIQLYRSFCKSASRAHSLIPLSCLLAFYLHPTWQRSKGPRYYMVFVLAISYYKPNPSSNIEDISLFKVSDTDFKTTHNGA